MSEGCPCGSGKDYEACCGPLHRGLREADTPEAVMRARYSAFVKEEIGYLERSYHPSTSGEFDAEAARKWAREAQWLGLEILDTRRGGPDDRVGTVEFVARYRSGDDEIRHHEYATFRRLDGRWLFVDGRVAGGGTYVRNEPKVGRNDPCPCGSGKKHKKCCGR